MSCIFMYVNAVSLRVLRGLQVHSSCKEQLSSKCPLGQCKVSVIPPTALNSIDSDGELLTNISFICLLL